LVIRRGGSEGIRCFADRARRAGHVGVYNIGLLQHQLIIFVAGLAVALSGVVIAFAGSVMGQRPENGNIADESQVSEVPREPSAPTPQSARFTTEEQAGANKRADRAVFLLGGAAVVALIIAGVTVA
jgi:hypothetical protein